MRKINPINNNGSIRIRFTYQGKRYNLSTSGSYFNNRDLAKASLIAAQIQLDIDDGIFDFTLSKYLMVKPNQDIQSNKPVNLLESWDMWVDSLELSEETKAGHYHQCRLLITKAKPNTTIEEYEWFSEVTGDISAYTFNKRLSYLTSFGKWAMSEGLIDHNPYTKIKRKRDVKVKDKVKPFSLDEIKLIVKGFDEIYPIYTPFVSFLFLTGVRTSEAIGLQWKRIDLDRGEITIADSLPRKATGEIKRDKTKSGKITVLPMSETLRNLLLSIPKCNPDDLVFRGNDGGAINRDSFRTAWKKVLKLKDIDYRTQYTSRHSLASHGIDQGMTLAEIAYILGHSDITMVSKTYGHLINRPNLPNIDI